VDGARDDSDTVAVRTHANESRELVRRKAEEVAALSWDELDAYGKQTNYATTPSGQRLRIVTHVYWDMEEWASGIEIDVKAYAARGWRRFRPYKAHSVRGGPDDLVPTRPNERPNQELH